MLHFFSIFTVHLKYVLSSVISYLLLALFISGSMWIEVFFGSALLTAFVVLILLNATSYCVPLYVMTDFDLLAVFTHIILLNMFLFWRYLHVLNSLITIIRVKIALITRKALCLNK